MRNIGIVLVTSMENNHKILSILLCFNVLDQHKVVYNFGGKVQ